MPYTIFAGEGGGFSGTKVNFIDIYSDGTLKFSIIKESPFWDFGIKVLNPDKKIGNYKTNGYNGVHTYYSLFMSDNMPSGGSIFESSPEHYLTINLKKAVKGSHYAGTFEGGLINAEGKNIKITDGRFDIKRK